MSIVLEGVGKDVGGETHLDGISMALENGSLNVLLGATLAGKTSLMRLMAGLDAPTRGRILVDGVDVTGQPVQRRNVAMVYQQFINYPSMTVYENIASPLRVSGRGAEVDAKVRRAAALLKLEPYLTRKPLELSGGQQQRTAIARALVKDAGLVLLDEPLANLDYKLREELREELPRIFAESGAVFVYATTEPSEALLLGGSTATLHQGRVTQFGPTPEVYRRPQDLVTAQVFSDPPLNVVSARKAAGQVTLEGGAPIPAAGVFASAPDGDYAVGFRAHHLSLEPAGERPIALPATVSVVEITGSESYVHLEAGQNRFVALVPGVRRLDPGSLLTVYLEPRRLYLFDRAGRAVAADVALAA
ncbi:ABC transporter ATP-binding protein [Alsobacter metallidurans]|uniref:ABC transporter ATP-binding protein n=1 Tax=Alsobacter metallidurans TaxID=340221 RepID=A0A917IBE6_9HYPH|nr:ABC transporter ATP-binding protein [Alsobacter metallidurans]GGH29470.1 ABC transporter ATP-binding protein [Alsobacter metallidurans]